MVLAGGRSLRMGRDKALLPFAGMSLLEHQVQLLQRSGVCDRIVISGERDGQQCDGMASVPDRYPGRGPLAALDALTTAFPGTRLLVVPIDMPLLAPNDLAQLAAVSAAPMRRYAGAMLPVCLLAAPRVAASLNALLAVDCARGASLHALATALDAEVLAMPEGARERFENINTPDDYKAHAR